MSAPMPLVSGPVRVALVGCGRISRNHFDAIARIDELNRNVAKLSAKSSASPRRAANGAAKPAAKRASARKSV